MTLHRLPEPAAWARRTRGESRAPEPPDPLEWRPPPSFRERVRSAVSTPALVGVLVFVAAVVSVLLLVLAQPHAVAADAADEGGRAAMDGSASNDTWSGVGDTGGAGAVGVADDAAAGGTVFVHVVGEVEEPGVVELSAGTRVQEAIEAAGGATEQAALDGINLARIVGDGEQIVVPDAEGAAEIIKGAESGGSGGGSSTAVVNLNSADAGALESLPRVGPALALRIIEWRDAHGGFSNPEQLLEVSGIGQKTLDGLRERIAV